MVQIAEQTCWGCLLRSVTVILSPNGLNNLAEVPFIDRTRPVTVRRTEHMTVSQPLSC
jgi:hypothetical protein